MKRYAIPILTLTILSFHSLLSAGGFHGKPSAPIRVEATLTGDSISAGIGEAVVRVTPLTEVDEVIVRAIPSEGIQIVYGEIEWRGNIEIGKTKIFRYTIEARDGSYEKITFTAAMEKRHFKASASAEIEINKHLKREKTRKIRVKKRDKGGSVIEMSGD